MQKYTLNELADFTQNEAELIGDIKKQNTNFEFKAPQRAVDAVLNYSRALSVRKTKTLGTVSMLLN